MIRTITAGLLAVVAIITAPAAHADPTTTTALSAGDQTFLLRMREGYGYDTPDASAFLGYAHEVCRRYNEYQSSVQVIDWLTQQIGQQMAIRVSTSAVMSYPNCGTLVGK